MLRSWGFLPAFNGGRAIVAVYYSIVRRGPGRSWVVRERGLDFDVGTALRVLHAS